VVSPSDTFYSYRGIIAYFVIKNDDPSKAKNCLWIGMILFAIGFIVEAVSE